MEHEPLAARLRPDSIDALLGQEAIFGADGPIRPWISARRIPSLLLFGPPGTGKTTLGRLLAQSIGAGFLTLNATTDGVADLRRRLEESDALRTRDGIAPLLFLDEIHRFNKSQQDGLLSAVESGRVTLVGATTETPWAGAINPALLSRLTVLRLQPLDETASSALLDRGAAQLEMTIDPDGRRNLIGIAGGDGRRLLNLLEASSSIARDAGRTSVTAQDLLKASQSRPIDYDRSGVVSAMIKSLRGGDVEAALYWAAVQLEAEGDARHLARRLVIAAGEEVGAADPKALPMAVACLEAVERIGLPEAHYPIAATIVYLAQSARDWSPGERLAHWRGRVATDGPRAVPSHLRASAKSYRHPAAGTAEGQRYLPADEEEHR